MISNRCHTFFVLQQENQRLLKIFPEYVNVRCRDSATFPLDCSNSSSLHGPEQVLMSNLNKTQVGSIGHSLSYLKIHLFMYVKVKVLKFWFYWG